MKLTYQTAAATFLQFIAAVMLGLPNALVSIISTCHSDSSNCISNMITSLIFFLGTAGWFGFIMLVGYFAQKNRSNRLAGLLIICELPTILTAGFFNFPREGSLLAKGTSLIDVCLGLAVIYIASKILFARGGRIVNAPRKRRNSP